MEIVMMNIEMEQSLRDDFKVWCIRNNTTMKEEVIKFIEKRIKGKVE